MLGKRRWLSIALVATLATLGFGLSAGADSASEGEFLAKINASRAADGLVPLSVDGSLQSHARNHTQDMIDSGGIYHSTSAELQAAAGSGWSKLGENVGRGGSVSSLHTAFMNSPGHKANIVGDYNKVGIGTGTSDGVLIRDGRLHEEGWFGDDHNNHTCSHHDKPGGEHSDHQGQSRNHYNHYPSDHDNHADRRSGQTGYSR